MAAGRKINSAPKRAMKDRRESSCMISGNLIQSPDDAVRLRVQPEDRRHARYLKRQPPLSKLGIEFITETSSSIFQLSEGIHAFDLLECCQASAHADWIRTQGSGLIHGSD